MQIELAATLRKHITNQWREGKVLVFPTNRFNESFPDLAALTPTMSFIGPSNLRLRKILKAAFAQIVRIVKPVLL